MLDAAIRSDKCPPRPKCILIARPEPGATETASRLVLLGYCPIVVPVLEIETRPFVVPDSIAATLLTSRNAIAACPPSLHRRPVFAVGSATAARATQAGFTQVMSADADAHALTRLVAGTLSPAGGSLLLPVGEGQGIEVATALRAHGFHVIRRIAYRAKGITKLPEAAATHLRERTLTAAMFFSGESSRHFVRLLLEAGLTRTVRDVEAVSISAKAAVALRVLPWRCIGIAAKPNQDAMLVLLS